MKRKHFILALVAMLWSFSISGYAQTVVKVGTLAELRAALATENVGQRAAAMRSAGVQQRAIQFPLELTANIAADDYNEILASVPSGWEITLDLRGFTLTGQLVNNGNLTIVDSSNPSTGKIYNPEGLAILNNGTMTINAGSIISGGTTAIENNGTLTIAPGVGVNGKIENVGDATFEGTTVVADGIAYANLQAAVNAVKNGGTIQLINDIVENVTLTEKVGLYYTIDGAGKTMNGTITVKALSDTEDNRCITIKKINFVETDNAKSTTFISSVETNHYPHLTIEGCTFTGSGYEDDVDEDVAVAIKSAKGVVIKDCTGTGLHSFLQNTSGWNLTIEGVTVTNSNAGLALGTVQGVTIKGSTIDVATYGIRMDAQYNNNAVIEGNNVTAFIPVVVRKVNTQSNVTITGENTFTAENTDGKWMVIGTTEYEENGKLPAETAEGNVVVALNGDNLSYAGVHGAGLAGKGTAEEPYLINNVAELEIFRNSVNAGSAKYSKPGLCIALGADIDMAGVNWVGIGTATADHGFMGNFDGKNFKIKNLTIENPALDSDGYAYAGLFGVTEGTDKDNQNTIKNLTIENVTINTTGDIVSAAIAYPYYTNVDNVKVCGDIKIQGGKYTAGVLAYTRRCVNASNLSIVGNTGSYVKGTQTVGGVISDIQMNGGLTAVYSNFSAEGITVTGEKSVGGIAGIIATQTLNGATVKNVTLNSTDEFAGVVAGRLDGTSTISNVVSENVTGATAVIGATYDGAKAVEARIGDTYYATLDAALAAEGDEVELFVPVTVAKDETRVLDLKGKTVSHSKACTASYEMIKNLGNLTIKNGTLSFTDTSAGDPSFGWGSYTINNYGTLVVEEGATIQHLGAQAFATHMIAAIQQAKGSTTINGGVISTPNYRSVRINGGALAINGGEFDGQVWLQPNQGDVTIAVNGGTFGPNGRDGSSIFMTNVGENKTVTSASITGGTFTTKIGCTDPAALAGIITGGKFTETAVTATNGALIGDGFTFDKNAENGYFAVVVGLDGDGTEAAPYMITSVKELELFRESVNKGETKYNAPGVWVALGADIDLANAEWTVGIGDGHNYSFDGNFDGKNYTIKNLNIKPYADADNYICGGLFGYTFGAVTIKNLVIENATVNFATPETGKTYHNVGILVGFANNKDGKLNVDNVIVKGDIKVDAPQTFGVGAIVGYSYREMGAITNTKVLANADSYIKGERFVGGITGYSYNNAIIDNCTVENLALTGEIGVGGIAGLALNGNNISKCTVKDATVNGDKNVAYIVGELGSGDGGNVTVADNCNAPQPWVGGSYATGESFVVTIGTQYYTSIAKAIEAAKETDVITLIADITATEPIAIPAGKKVTLDLNGKTITGTDNGKASYGLININPEAELIINDAVGNGAIKLEATQNRGWNAYSSVISNQRGKLTVNGGTIEHLGGTDMAYAIDNLTNTGAQKAETVINGGVIKSTYRAIRQFLNSTSAENILTVNGGTIEGGNKSIWMQDANKSANPGALTVAEDAQLKGDVYLFVTAGSTEWPVSVSIAADALQGESQITTGNVPAGYELSNINGTYGVYNGAAKIGNTYYETFYAAYKASKTGDVVTLLKTVVIDGGTWVNYSTKNITVKAAFGDAAFRVQGNPGMVWFGGMTIESDDYCIIVGAKDGSTGADVDIYGGTYNGATTAISVTKGSVNIMDGTFKVEPYEDNYNYTINCIDAAYNSGAAKVTIKGGKFYNFNPMNNAAEGAGTNFLVANYAATLDADGYWNVVKAIAKIGKVCYATLADAVEAANDGDVITLVNTHGGKISAAGAVINKSVTIDFNGVEYSLTEGVGSGDLTSNGLQILKGNNVTLKNGTLKVADEAAEKFYILVQNYADLTVKDMNLDGTNLDKWSTHEDQVTNGDSYVLSNNSGNVVIKGNTNIKANNEGSKAFAFDACDKTANGYTLPVVTVETTGHIAGKIENSATIVITNGTYTENVQQYCAEDYECKAGENGVYGVAYNPAYAKDAMVTATDGTISYYKVLTDAVAAAANGATVDLLRDVVLTGVYADATEALRIESAITFNGNGHIIESKTEKGVRIYNPENEKNFKVTFNNVNIVNNVKNGRCIDTRSGNIVLRLSESTLTATNGNSQPLTIGGSEQIHAVTLSSVEINAGLSGYGVINFVAPKQFITTAGRTKITGYAAFYVKADGTTLNIGQGTETGGNNHSGESDDFGTIVLETSNNNVNITSSNPYIYAIANGTATQAAFLVLGDNNSVNINPTEGKEGGVILEGENAYWAMINAESTGNKFTKKGVELVSVAEVGGFQFLSLEEAYRYAKAGETIKVINNVEGEGLVINKNVTIDFNGKTYSFTEGVGSGDLTSNGFQILEGNDVVLKNGTLKVADEAAEKFYILVQNYADNLTVENMTLDGTNLDKWSKVETDQDSYVLSNNHGNVTITGATNIIANDEGNKAFAFDVCKYASYDAPKVTVTTTGTIAGKIEVSEGIEANLDIKSGTYTQDVVAYCEEMFACRNNGNDTWTVLPAVARVNGEVSYATLAEAVAAAEGEATIVMLADELEANAVTVAADKNITLDLNGKTVAMEDASAAAMALITNKGTLTINSSVEGGKLSFESTNPSAANAYASNVISNQGTITINAGTVENLSTGGACYALDNYAGSTATINGGKLTAVKTAVRIFNWTNGEEAKATLNVVNGEIYTEKGYGINVNSGNAPYVALNISGGTITTNDTDYNLAVYIVNKATAENLSVNVTGGTFNGNFALNGATSSTMAKNAVSISGGTFEGVICYADPAHAFISGGTFASDVQKYCVYDYECQAGENGVYSVVYNPEYLKDAKVIYADGTATSYHEKLVDAVAAATKGATVELLRDVVLTGGYADATEALRIESEITFNGNGHTIESKTERGVRIYNLNKKGNFQVTINNVTITNDVKNGRCIDTRSGDINLKINNSKLIATNGNTQPLTIGGNDPIHKVALSGTTIDAGNSGYGIICFVSTNNSTTLSNTKVSGYAGIYVKGDNKNVGFLIDYQSAIIGKNIHNGESNTFGAVVLEGNNTYVNLNGTNVSVKAIAEGTASQAAFLILGKNNKVEIKKESAKVITEGENAYWAMIDAENANSISIVDKGETLAPVAQADGFQFLSLEEAYRFAKDGGEIKFVSSAEGPGLVINKNLTFDFDGKKYSFTEGVGSTGTETNGFQILEGNEVVLKDGTLDVAGSAADKFYILVQNYADKLTVNDMTLDGANLDKYAFTDGDSYTLSNNHGEVVISGETNIYANEDGDLAFAFDVCKYASYTEPTVTITTSGRIKGGIEVSEGLEKNLIISGGTYDVDVTEHCAEGHTVKPNEDDTYSVVTGVTLIDGQFSEYTNAEDKEVDYISYTRASIPTTWTPIYLPFEVPVSLLADKFEVAYINGVRRGDTNFDGELDNFVMEVIYIHGGNADGSRKTLKANYPYFIRSKNGVREDLNITVSDATLYAAANATYDCTTMTEMFELTGTTKTMAYNEGDFAENDYCVIEGGWYTFIQDDILKPFRFYMTVTDRIENKPIKTITTMSIAVRGEEREDGTTLIYDIEEEQTVDYIYDLHGRRVMEPQKGGIYIINGKKVVF